MAVRPLRREEIPAAAETLALAFHEDPLFAFLVPREVQRRKWLRWLHTWTLGECIAVGGAFVPEEGPEAGAIGVLPPGAWPPPVKHTLAAMTWPTPWPTFRLVGLGMQVQKVMLGLHPRTPHLYVYVLGVHPEKKGTGLGAALLRHGMALGEAAGAPSYLETANPVNLTFYRKYGFEIVETIDRHVGPPVWTMITGKGGGGGRGP